MASTTELTLTEKLKNHNDNLHINLHEVARELTRYCKTSDTDGLKNLQEAYIRGLKKNKPFASREKIINQVNENLFFTAVLADIMNHDGYEASGQILGAGIMIDKKDITNVIKQPVAQFYLQTTGYEPKYKI